MSSTNPVTLVFHDFFLSMSVVVNPVVCCSVTVIIGMLMNVYIVLADHVPCPEPCIGDSVVLV